MSIYIINISQQNWPSCERDTVFGIPESEVSYPNLTTGKVVLVRRCDGMPYGCAAVWEFLREESVPEEFRKGPNRMIPWSDRRYSTKQCYRSLARIDPPMSERFNGQFSAELGWHINELHRSVVELSPHKSVQYVGLLLQKCGDQMTPEIRVRLVAQTM